MNDPASVALTVEACVESDGQSCRHLTDANGVSVRVSAGPHGTAEDAGAAGQAALRAFGSVALGPIGKSRLATAGRTKGSRRCLWILILVARP